MKDFEACARQFYAFSNIPVFLYNARTCVACFPSELQLFTPPAAFQDTLFSPQKQLHYACFRQEVSYGTVCLNDSDYRLVFGPVIRHFLSGCLIEQLSIDYAIRPADRKFFFESILTLPRLVPSAFVGLLHLADQLLNSSPMQEEFMLPANPSPAIADNSELQQQAYYNQAEDGLLYSNLEIEEEMCSIIEHGDAARLREFCSRNDHGHYFGLLAPDHLRSLKNMFLVMDTLCARAAIRGGLSPVVAFSIADTYSRQVETTWDEDFILRLMPEVQMDFCTRVANLKHEPVQVDILQKAMDYVHQNVNMPIDVGDVAKAVGLSRSYLSRYFKQEVGESLSGYIRRVKLETGRNLLLYSDKSIGHISAFLCFSSQSHFQTLFKKQFGLTPLECRRGKRTSVDR